MNSILVKDLGFYRKLMAIAIPTALQFLVTVSVNLIDTIMVGSLGETALSATALANQFINIFHVFCMGTGMGASVLVSRYWGMNDLPSLKKSLTIMLRLVTVMGTFFALCCFFVPTTIMGIFTPETALIELGSVYFKWSTVTCLAMGFSMTVTIILRSVGQAIIPFVASVGALGLNVFFNYMFIFGKFGAPRMEVAGAAIGTLIARLFEAALICGYLLFVDKKIRYQLRDYFMKCSDMVGEYIRISIPVLISDSLLAFGNSAVAIIMGRIGSSFVAANSVTVVTQQLATALTQGISQAGCVITGHTIGEGNSKQAQQQSYTFLLFGFLIGTVGCGIIALISEPIIGCYNLTPQTQAIARQLMMAVGFIVIFQSANSIITKGVLRGGGDTKVLMIADNIFLWIVSIPLGALAGLHWRLPAFWIYCCLKMDNVLKCVWCVFRLRSGKWIKVIHSAAQS